MIEVVEKQHIIVSSSFQQYIDNCNLHINVTVPPHDLGNIGTLVKHFC